MLRKIKQIIKVILFRPWRFKQFGSNSAIRVPYHIKGRKFISIGRNTDIKKHSTIIGISLDNNKKYFPEITIGSDVYIGSYFHLYSMSNVLIGNGCVISDNVYISGASHGVSPDDGLIMSQALAFKDIKIENNCFIGRNVFISPGVILGNNCVVGANSVVTKSFPAYSMIAGSPARIIKKYSKSTKKWIKV